MQNTGATYPEYYHVMEHVHIDPDAISCVEALREILTNILYCSPVIVQLNNKKHDTHLAQQVTGRIKKLPNIEMCG